MKYLKIIILAVLILPLVTGAAERACKPGSKIGTSFDYGKCIEAGGDLGDIFKPGSPGNTRWAYCQTIGSECESPGSKEYGELYTKCSAYANNLSGEAKAEKQSECKALAPKPEPIPAPVPKPATLPPTIEINLLPNTPALTIPVAVPKSSPTPSPIPKPVMQPAPTIKLPAIKKPQPKPLIEKVEPEEPQTPEEVIAMAEQEVIQAFKNKEYAKIHARTATVTRSDGTKQKILVMPRPGIRHGEFEYSIDGQTYTNNLRSLLKPSPIASWWGKAKRVFSAKPTEKRAIEQVAGNLLVETFRFAAKDNTGRTSLINQSDFASMLAEYAKRRDLGDRPNQLFADGSEFVELVQVKNRSLNDLNVKLFEAGYQELLRLREFQQI